jgi:4-amino-4-deoxy-L-arabinose transferase-like glycosyltransferase
MFLQRQNHLLFVGAIVLLATGIRFFAIDQPFIDVWSWRQSDVAAIAQNYYQNGYHFAYPQIDWSGTAPGYVGTEFPILPFIAAGFYKVAGVHEWIGRLESVIFFALSVPFFFALAREIFGDTAGRWAVVFYGFAPLAVMTSRCFMPDMPSLGLSIVGLYFFMRWLETNKSQPFIVGAFSIALALLIKLPSAIIGAPMACLALERFGKRAIREFRLWLFGALVLIPSFAWYLHAAHVTEQFYPHHFFGEGGVRVMPLNWYWDILCRMTTSSLTIVPCVLALLGLFIGVRTKQSSLFHWWLGIMILFVVVVGYGNRHPWYQLPFVPIVAAFSGAAVAYLHTHLRSHFWARATIYALIVVAFAGQSFIATRKLYRPAAANLRTLGLALGKHTPPGSLIVIADYGDPTAFYYAQRKGWHFLEKDAIYNGHPNTSADAIVDLEHLRQRGATHIAFYSSSGWWLDYYREFAEHLEATSTPVERTQAYQIFELRR